MKGFTPITVKCAVRHRASLEASMANDLGLIDNHSHLYLDYAISAPSGCNPIPCTSACAMGSATARSAKSWIVERIRLGKYKPTFRWRIAAGVANRPPAKSSMARRNPPAGQSPHNVASPGLSVAVRGHSPATSPSPMSSCRLPIGARGAKISVFSRNTGQGVDDAR